MPLCVSLVAIALISSLFQTLPEAVSPSSPVDPPLFVITQERCLGVWGHYMATCQNLSYAPRRELGIRQPAPCPFKKRDGAPTVSLSLSPALQSFPNPPDANLRGSGTLTWADRLDRVARSHSVWRSQLP